jgi:hypothetical protein
MIAYQVQSKMMNNNNGMLFETIRSNKDIINCLIQYKVMLSR